MQEGSGSRVKGDYPDNSDNNESREPKPIEPVKKKYGTFPDDNGNGTWVTAENVSYDINIKPDKNGRLKF